MENGKVITNEVLAERIEGLKNLTENRFDNVDKKFEESEKKHEDHVNWMQKNSGRIKKLETWRSLIIGGLIVLNVVVLPIIIAIIDKYFIK